MEPNLYCLKQTAHITKLQLKSVIFFYGLKYFGRGKTINTKINVISNVCGVAFVFQLTVQTVNEIPGQ
jgi:hypothetical protein